MNQYGGRPSGGAVTFGSKGQQLDVCSLLRKPSRQHVIYCFPSAVDIYFWSAFFFCRRRDWATVQHRIVSARVKLLHHDPLVWRQLMHWCHPFVCFIKAWRIKCPKVLVFVSPVGLSWLFSWFHKSHQEKDLITSLLLTSSAFFFSPQTTKNQSGCSSNKVTDHKTSFYQVSNATWSCQPHQQAPVASSTGNRVTKPQQEPKHAEGQR